MFSSFQSWLFERKSTNIRYDCIMLYADIPDWNSHTSIIVPDDIYTVNGDFGIENEPHVTIIYGLHSDLINREGVYSIISEIIKPITVTIDTINYFSDKNNKEYDVVKYDIPVTEELKYYRKIFLSFPNTQSFKSYHPHMTIAYVKKGKAKKYTRKVKPFKVIFDKVVYSRPGNNKKYINLK